MYDYKIHNTLTSACKGGVTVHKVDLVSDLVLMFKFMKWVFSWSPVKGTKFI